MDFIENIILGLIQGMTEFIPISSSGHLVIAQHIFEGASDHLFLEWINIGTLLALLVYFRKRIITIIRDILKNHDYKLAINILITAVPAGLIGFMLADFIDATPFFGSLVTVTVTLAVVGFIMIILDKLPRKTSVNNLSDMHPGRALTIGVVQVFALIPGVSRSGSTIIAGRLMGLNAAAAAEYSFLASLPIMFGVTLKLVASASDREYFAAHAVTLLASNLVAFLSGWAAVGLLMKYLSRHSLALFGWYRIALAGVLAVVLLVQLYK